MQKSKKPRENKKNNKTKKNNIPEVLETPGVNRQEFWILCIVLFSGIFFLFFGFFGFLEVFLIFAFFTFTRVLEYWFYCFFVFFGFLEVFWKFGEVKENMFFGNFAKLKKHLSFAKIQKSQDYAYILEYFGNFRKTPLFAIYPFLLYWIAHIIICLSFVFMY